MTDSEIKRYITKKLLVLMPGYKRYDKYNLYRPFNSDVNFVIDVSTTHGNAFISVGASFVKGNRVMALAGMCDEKAYMFTKSLSAWQYRTELLEYPVAHNEEALDKVVALFQSRYEDVFEPTMLKYCNPEVFLNELDIRNKESYIKGQDSFRRMNDFLIFTYVYKNDQYKEILEVCRHLAQQWCDGKLDDVYYRRRLQQFNNIVDFLATSPNPE